MVVGLKRYQQMGHLHFVTFRRYRRQAHLGVSWGFVDGAGTLGNRTTLRFKGEFALTAIDNDLFSRPSLLWS